MKITNISSSDLTTKLGNLIEDFLQSPYRAAPERKAELETILAEKKIEIYLKPDDTDWVFKELRMANLIFISIRTIERIWALVYGYNAIVSSIQSSVNRGLGTHTTTDEDVLAYELINWAINPQDESWPDGLPSPQDKTQNVHDANELFLTCSARLILHEVGHSVLNHSTGQESDAELLKREEFEADAWADEWMLRDWKKHSEDERVFIKRTLGIAFSHAPKLALGANRLEKSQTHPPPMQRVLRFLTTYFNSSIPDSKSERDMACAFLMFITYYLLWKKFTDSLSIPNRYTAFFERFDDEFN